MALIQHMVPTCDYYPDRDYLFAFLLSARLFIRPYELLERVCHFCDIQQRLDSSSTASTPKPTTTTTTHPRSPTITQKSQFARHYVKLLAEWIDTFPYDFRDDRMMQHVRQWTQRCIAVDGRLRSNVSTMLQQLQHRLTILDQYEERLAEEGRRSAALASKSSGGSAKEEVSGGGSGISASSSASVDINELCTNSAAQLAQQLTHIELERLAHIGPEEFVQSFAKDTMSPDAQQSSDVKKTRNLESYVQWFNRLSYLVATEIVKVILSLLQFKFVQPNI